MPRSGKRILLIRQELNATGGGGNLVAAFIVEALKADNAVSILTWSPVKTDALNRNFATSLREAEFSLVLPPMFLRAVVNLSSILSPLRYGVLLRIAKKIRNHYDLIISVNNEADFGRKGIQYVHDPPYWLYAQKRRSQSTPLSSNNLWTAFKGEKPSVLPGGFSYERMKNNITLVNSNWTRERLKEVYAIESTVVYPPVVGRFFHAAWKARENGFVSIGRFSRIKAFERIIQIINGVRETAPDAHLHIVGTSSDRTYAKRLFRLTKKFPWITLSENISRGELTRLISAHRYGIHGMEDEPYGLAVAEMVKGGCIVFVPRQGGSSEIVGSDDRLLYNTVEEAIRKIDSVITNRDQQLLLRQFLSSKCNLSTKDVFTRRIRKIVQEFPLQSAPPLQAVE